MVAPMTGRPSKLNATLLAKLDAIADDQWSIRDACDQLDIGETTWRRWEADDSADDLAVEFRRLAARVRAGAGAKIDDLAWGALREVLENDGEWVEGPDGEREYVRGSSDATKVAAAAAVLRLRTAHKVELTGAGGGPVEVSIEDARAKLLEGIKRSAPAEPKQDAA